MKTHMADLLDITHPLEESFLASHAETAKEMLDEARADGVSTGGLAQLEAALEAVRVEGIGRIRSSTLLAMAAWTARNDPA